MPKIATPISHLFVNAKNAKRICKASDCLECRDRSIDNKSLNQELFHCELQPIHKFTQEDFDYLEKIKQTKKDLKLITFHMATSCSMPKIDKSKIKSGMFIEGGYQYSKEEMLKNIKENLAKIKTIFGKEVKIGVENNNYYPSNAYKYITDANFIKQVVYENDIFFLFDIAHAQVTAHNKNIEFDDYKNNLPLDKTIQLHICSPDIDSKSNLAYDAHNYPDDFKMQEIKKMLDAYPAIKYLTVEYYRDIDELIQSIEKVRELI